MSDHESLQEKYEDSLFALLMDELAESEGERLIQENERLLQDPSAAVPPASERRFLQTIERETTKRKRQQSSHKVLHLIWRLAIGALIAVLLFGSAFALSPSFRAGTLNLLMQIDDRVASWDLFPETIDDSSQHALPSNIEVRWLPEGYVKTDPFYDADLSLLIECTNNTGGSIEIIIQSDNGSFFTFDVEDADSYSELTIQNNSALLIVKGDMLHIAWTDAEKNYSIGVSSSDVDVETLVRVAESIVLS